MSTSCDIGTAPPPATASDRTTISRDYIRHDKEISVSPGPNNTAILAIPAGTVSIEWSRDFVKAETGVRSITVSQNGVYESAFGKQDGNRYGALVRVEGLAPRFSTKVLGSDNVEYGDLNGFSSNISTLRSEPFGGTAPYSYVWFINNSQASTSNTLNVLGTRTNDIVKLEVRDANSTLKEVSILRIKCNQGEPDF